MISPVDDFLPIRLKTVHDIAVAGIEDCDRRRIVDIGSDHGHLSLYALVHDNFEKAILTDIHQAPARRSEDTLRMYGFSDKSEVYCTDGLDGVKLRQGDIIVMAGLGGNNMTDIMKRAVKSEPKEILTSLIWCLQPQKSSDKLREYLFTNGFDIVDENSCEDRQINYVIIKAVYTGVNRSFTLKEKYYGPVILERAGKGEPQALNYKNRLDERFALAQRGDDEIREMMEEK